MSGRTPSAHDRHDDDRTTRAAPTGRLLGALGLTVAFMVVEVAVGLAAHSLALLSDAAHMIADAGALALALFAQRVAARPRTPQRTFGSRRAETMAALFNGVVLGVSSVWVVVEAISRWRHPPDVQGGWMLLVATIGLFVNLAAAWVLSRGSEGHNTNTKAALAHVASDTAGSVVAIVAAGLVLVFGWRRADPAMSIVLSLLIVYAAWKIVRRTVDVLMQGTPSGVDVPAIERTIASTPGVSAQHDLHVWRVTDGFDVLTVHIRLDGSRPGPDVSTDVCARIARAHGITHATVQAESNQGAREWIAARDLVRTPST